MNPALWYREGISSRVHGTLAWCVSFEATVLRADAHIPLVLYVKIGGTQCTPFS